MSSTPVASPKNKTRDTLDMRTSFLLLSLMALPLTTLAGDVAGTWKADPASAPAQPAAPGRRGNQPIVLNEDDKPAFPEPPEGFNKLREGIQQGALTVVSYDSKTLGTTRQVRVYTPPGYSADKKYPVL